MSEGDSPTAPAFRQSGNFPAVNRKTLPAGAGNPVGEWHPTGQTCYASTNSMALTIS